MPQKHKRSTLDTGNIIGAIIFIALFAGLILLGIYAEDPEHFNGSFFEDIGKIMQEQE